MGAKDKFIDKISKLNSEGLSGDAMSKSKDDAQKEATLIGDTMLGMVVPPATLCIKQTTGGLPNVALIKLMDIGGSVVLKAALLQINSSGAPPAALSSMMTWSNSYSDAVKEFCTSVGIPKQAIIENPAPAAGVPNPPIPIMDMKGVLAKFQKDFVEIKRNGVTDPKALSGILPWAGQVAAALSSFIMTLVVPPAVGFVVITNVTPPIVGILNPMPLQLSDS